MSMCAPVCLCVSDFEVNTPEGQHNISGEPIWEVPTCSEYLEILEQVAKQIPTS